MDTPDDDQKTIDDKSRSSTDENSPDHPKPLGYMTQLSTVSVSTEKD